jgi:hypothetical protein
VGCCVSFFIYGVFFYFFMKNMSGGVYYVRAREEGMREKRMIDLCPLCAVTCTITPVYTTTLNVYIAVTTYCTYFLVITCQYCGN